MVKIFIKTFGCSLNQADSKLMENVLVRNGFELTDRKEEADIFIVNTCTVKKPTENKVLKYIKDFPKNKTIVTGCLPQTTPEKVAGYSLIGTHQLENIVEVVEEVMNNSNLVNLSEGKNPSLEPAVSGVISIIPICRGCLGNCSYCIVKKARGNLISYESHEIIQAVKESLTKGAKEIWLTAQDTGCYGFDIGTDLVELLKKLVNTEGDFKIRVGMMNPHHALKVLDELVEVFKSENVFKFLHLPVQSGNDKILKLMNREYTVKDFKKVVDRFKEKIPDLTLSTDVIVGFPSETEEQFEDTLELIKEVQPDIVNISRFGKRPGTKAAEMEDQIVGWKVKERSRKMTDICANIGKLNNEKWYNWKGKVLIDEDGKKKTMKGRNYAYKPVVVPGEYELGEEVKVRIRKVTSFDLRAE